LNLKRYYPRSVNTSGYYGPVFVKCLSFKTFWMFLIMLHHGPKNKWGVLSLPEWFKPVGIKKRVHWKIVYFLIKCVKQHFRTNIYHKIINYTLLLKNFEFVQTICILLFHLTKFNKSFIEHCMIYIFFVVGIIMGINHWGLNWIR